MANRSADHLRTFIANQFNAHCQLCRMPIEGQRPSLWCHHCHEHFFQAIARCESCGLPTLTPTPACGQCLANPPKWHRLYCVGDYQPPLSHYIHQFKYQKKFWHANNLAQLLVPRIDSTPDLICYVPMHWRRYWMRGFNQSELLARSIARSMHVPLSHKLFSRIKATKQQQGLDKDQRKQNLHQAFKLNHRPKVKHVAIVDDVVTTGSTVEQLCHLLLEASVETVDIYCICRTPEPSDR